jgi:hypothetical protein
MIEEENPDKDITPNFNPLRISSFIAHIYMRTSTTKIWLHLITKTSLAMASKLGQNHTITTSLSSLVSLPPHP